MGDELDTMRIWDAVCQTNPSETKRVKRGERGREFTAVDAYARIRDATRLFGPVGEGWGWHEPRFEVVGDLLLCHLQVWHGERDNIVYCVGTAKTHSKYGQDEDAPKKALTDGLTKGLSYLGFAADVFLGKFDDNKYVAAQRERERDKERGNGNGHDKEEPAAPESDDAYISVADAREAVKQAVRSMHFPDNDVTDMLQDWHQAQKVDALPPEVRANVVEEMTRRADLYGKLWAAYQQINAGHGLSEKDAIEGLHAWLVDQAKPDGRPLRHPAAEWRDWLDNLRKVVPTQ